MRFVSRGGCLIERETNGHSGKKDRRFRPAHIWLELTAPHNYASLRRYVQSKDPAGINEYAFPLHHALLAEAGRRMAESR